jgi:hypothetical protein
MASTTGQRALESVFSTPENVGNINDYELPNQLVVESEKAWEDGQGYSVYKVSKVGASKKNAMMRMRVTRKQQDAGWLRFVFFVDLLLMMAHFHPMLQINHSIQSLLFIPTTK